MDHNLEPIIGPILPMRIWGTDVHGSIFRQSVNARDVSETGALLDGLKQKMHLGDLLGVEYDNHKAHARITGIGEATSSQSVLCSVQLLENATCPWKGALPKTAYEGPPPPKERRRHERYRVPVGLEIRPLSDVPMYVCAADVSAGGCYVETILPMKKGTEMQLTIWLESGRIVSKGIVRTSDISVGMGIEFVGMTPAEVDLLQQFLQAQAAVGSATVPD
jgi:hypothetical protein